MLCGKINSLKIMNLYIYHTSFQPHGISNINLYLKHSAQRHFSTDFIKITKNHSKILPKIVLSEKNKMFI